MSTDLLARASHPCGGNSIGPGGEESTSWKPSRLQGVGPMGCRRMSSPEANPKVLLYPSLLQLAMILGENGEVNMLLEQGI